MGKKMVKSGAAAEVVYDPSRPNGHRSRSEAYASERQNFLSGNLADMYRKQSSRELDDPSDSENEDTMLKKLLKEVEHLSASSMPWKDRKKLENQKVVNLGGKAPKKHRTPLSVAIPAMKNQKKREQKKMEEDLFLGQFNKKIAKKNEVVKRRPEDRVLKATDGHFSRGVLHVKHLLAPAAPPKGDDSAHKTGKGKGKRKGKGKGKKGKGKGGRKRH